MERGLLGKLWLGSLGIFELKIRVPPKIAIVIWKMIIDHQFVGCPMCTGTQYFNLLPKLGEYNVQQQEKMVCAPNIQCSSIIVGYFPSLVGYLKVFVGHI